MEFSWGSFPWGGGPWGGLSLNLLRERRRAKIVWLVDVELLGSGAPVLRLSNRNLEYNIYRYEKYILKVSGIARQLSRLDSDSLNSPVSILFENRPFMAFDYLIEAGQTYPFEGARCTVSALHLDDDGNPTEAEIVFVGVLDEPQSITKKEFSCMASSVEFFSDLRTGG